MSAVTPIAAPIFTRRKHLEHHREHHGKNQTRADALHQSPKQQHLERGSTAAHERTGDKRAKRKQRELAHGKPLHKNARKRHDKADYQHVSNDEPLRDGSIDAKCHAKLRQGDIQARLAEHAGKTTQIQAHHCEIGVRNLHARFIKTMRHKCATNSFLSKSTNAAIGR